MKLYKRELIGLGLGSIAALALPALPAFAEGDKAAARIKDFAGGKEPATGKVALTTPEIAENGNTVPVEFEAEGATSVVIFASGNPNPGVATFHFGALAPSAASTRIRLAGTQDLVAIAQMADGSYARATRNVKVTIGGCGG